jgi:hypothetical protein
MSCWICGEKAGWYVLLGHQEYGHCNQHRGVMASYPANVAEYRH